MNGDSTQPGAPIPRRPRLARTTYVGFAVVIGLTSWLLASPRTAGRARREQTTTATTNVRDKELFTEYVAGLLVRSTYQADASGTTTVRIWDLLVGPGKRSEPVALPGAVVLTLRSGSGLILVDGERQETAMGASMVIPEDATIEFDNRRGEQPIAARAILISRR